MHDHLKPVLVIDNREEYAPAGDNDWLVRKLPSADTESLDPSDYAAIFVHDDNMAELNWARKHAKSHFNGLYFKFTGRKGQFDNVTYSRGAYKLPRWIFKERFAEFLEMYKQRGVVDRDTARIFEKL